MLLYLLTLKPLMVWFDCEAVPQSIGRMSFLLLSACLWLSLSLSLPAFSRTLKTSKAPIQPIQPIPCGLVEKDGSTWSWQLVGPVSGRTSGPDESRLQSG